MVPSASPVLPQAQSALQGPLQEGDAMAFEAHRQVLDVCDSAAQVTKGSGVSPKLFFSLAWLRVGRCIARPQSSWLRCGEGI